MSRKQNKFYVSDIDRFLEDFNRSHSKSAEQLAEIKKYQRIFRLRDTILPDQS